MILIFPFSVINWAFSTWGKASLLFGICSIISLGLNDWFLVSQDTVLLLLAFLDEVGLKTRAENISYDIAIYQNDVTDEITAVKQGFSTFYEKLNNGDIVLYNILEQKLLSKTNTNQNNPIVRLKSAMFNEGLVKKLQNKYKTEIFIQGL